jgi:hypothetical protein
MTFDVASGVAVLFGGGLTQFGNPVYNDTWEWNGSTWTQRAPATVPPARWGSFLCADWGAGNVVMFGGRAGAAGPSLADTWIWNGFDWQPRSPAQAPSSRVQGGSCYDLTRGVVMIHGGNGAASPADSTWLWDGVDWRLDPRTPAPSGRQATAMAFDLPRQRCVLFGGYEFGTLSDTWEYEGGGLAMWAVFGNGCPGPAGTPSLTTVGTLPVLGSTLALRVTYGIGAAAGLLAVGLSDQQWGGGALPQSLAPIGMPGCSLRVSTEWLGGLTLSSGVANVAWQLPSAPAFVGFQFFAQGLVLDPTANPFGAVVTDAGAGVLGLF